MNIIFTQNFFTIVDRIIIREIFREKVPLNAYYFHKKYKLSPVQIIASVRKLSAIGLIDKNLKKLTLTEYGVKFSIAYRHIIFGKPENEYWKDYRKAAQRSLVWQKSAYTPEDRHIEIKFFERLLQGRSKKE